MEKPAYQCKNVVSSSHSTQNLSRLDLLNWINESLGLKVKKVESLCSGSAYCQFMNMLFPGCISIKKIKLDASVQYEFISNLKQLQIAFRTVGCDKDVPIEKLIKGRFQENFEFVQWFKKFIDANIDAQSSSLNKNVSKQPNVLKKNATSVFPQSADSETCLGLKKNPVKNINSELAELAERAEEINKEKTFYYNKLRNIETLCSEFSENASAELDKKTLISKILAELYATEDNVESAEDEEETY